MYANWIFLSETEEARFKNFLYCMHFQNNVMGRKYCDILNEDIKCDTLNIIYILSYYILILILSNINIFDILTF